MNDLSCGLRMWATFLVFITIHVFDRRTRIELPSQYRALRKRLHAVSRTELKAEDDRPCLTGRSY